MFCWKKKTSIALANAFEFYDVAIYSVISVYIGLHFFPSHYFGQHATSIIWATFALRYLSRPFGGLIMGMYADKYGRKAALMTTSLLSGLATLCMSCLPTFDDIGVLAPCLFFMLQLMQAFSFGGENSTTVLYLMENTYAQDRAKTSALVWGVLFFIIALALLTVYVLELVLTPIQMNTFGWRIPLLLGVVNIFFRFYFRTKITESANFSASDKVQVHLRSAFKIFLMSIPFSMLCYLSLFFTTQVIQTLSPDPFIQKILPIGINCSCFFLALLMGYFVDRHSQCLRILNRCCAALVLGSVPIYAIQANGDQYSLIVSQLCLTILLACIIATSPFVLFNQLQGDNKATTFGVGYNCSVVIFGASIPLMVHYLSQFGTTYIGLMLSGGGLCYFIAQALD
ncbi:MAG: MFS transporter [Shewanellaceae bacterium]|nr:MFS transporter [Shewanellaceae bacterium]